MPASPALLTLLAALIAPSAPAPAPSDAAAPDPAAVAPPADLLAGPTVDEDDAPSIVEQSFDGRMTPLVEPPDVAAVRALTLTPEQQATFDRLLAERATIVDRLVVEHYEDVATLNAGERGSPDKIAVYQRLRVAFKPLLDRGSMVDEMRPALTPDQRTEAARMMDEYRAARAKAIERETGRPLRARRLDARLQLETVGREIRASVERRVDFGQARFDEFADHLALTPEQTSTIQGLVQPLGLAELGGSASPEMRTRVMRAVFEVLTPDQRRLARERFGPR